jgi:hypothetical protein
VARVAAFSPDLGLTSATMAAKVLEYEHEIRLGVRDNELARRAQTRQGTGLITASALVATVGNGRDLKNGRRFTARLPIRSPAGLVPCKRDVATTALALLSPLRMQSTAIFFLKHQERTGRITRLNFIGRALGVVFEGPLRPLSYTRKSSRPRANANPNINPVRALRT